MKPLGLPGEVGGSPLAKGKKGKERTNVPAVSIRNASFRARREERGVIRISGTRLLHCLLAPYWRKGKGGSHPREKREEV